ncbi:MAG: molybdenum cofactor guanylyltransferase [Acidimicrobiales bacterium]
MTTVPGGPSRFAAVVVAGGSARRMGGIDKLALDVGGRPILDHVLAAARPLCETVVVVGPARATGVPDVAFTVEAEPGGGPVPAVAAGLAAVATTMSIDDDTAVAVLAADLPLLTTAHVALLFEALADPSARAAAAVDDEGRPHPLLAVHRSMALQACLTELAAVPAGMAGSPALSGLPATRLLPADVVTVALGPAATLNVNRPADLDRARHLIGARQ